MDSRDFTIGILATTATILLVGVLLISTRPAPVLAAGMTQTLGDYVITVGVGLQNDQDVVYILDAQEQKVAGYQFNPGRKEIELRAGIDLAPALESQNKAPQPGRRGRP
ncbi:MAG: hypothetical protein J5J06_17285 [Phycisphaerae bacterium]|nr:hypothetical protein [Phycisphaerae bacterium]